MRLAVLFCVLSLAACDSERPAEWSYIHETILRPSCSTVSCHSRANGQSGVRLESAAAAYSILTGRACADVTLDNVNTRNFVFPGDPTRSRLIHLLKGEHVLRAMPPDRLLPIADIELIEEWILEGAQCN